MWRGISLKLAHAKIVDCLRTLDSVIFEIRLWHAIFGVSALAAGYFLLFHETDQEQYFNCVDNLYLKENVKQGLFENLNGEFFVDMAIHETLLTAGGLQSAATAQEFLENSDDSDIVMKRKYAKYFDMIFDIIDTCNAVFKEFDLIFGLLFDEYDVAIHYAFWKLEKDQKLFEAYESGVKLRWTMRKDGG